jgi:hypothetical protein
MGKKKKVQNALSFLFFLSLSPFLLLQFSFVSLFLFCCTRAIGRIFSSKGEKKKKERKRDISIQQKHNNDDAAAVYCLSTDTTYTTAIRGKKRTRRKEKEI